MARLKTDEGAIFYEVRGEGVPLVALRGLGRSVRHWLGYERELSKTYKVITLDLRGIGRSTIQPGWNLTIYDMADDVVRVLDHLGIEQAHVFGISLGGMVTLALGLKYPDRCRSLIVANTSIAGQRTLRMSLAAVAALTNVVKDRSKLEEKLIEVLLGNDCLPEIKSRAAAQYRNIDLNDPVDPLVVAKQLFAAARFQVTRPLRDMAVPTLVIYGTHDRFVPNINSRKLYKLLPRASLKAIEGGGHEICIDKGPETKEAIDHWISKLEEQGIETWRARGVSVGKTCLKPVTDCRADSRAAEPTL